jgi:hypothetical protein
MKIYKVKILIKKTGLPINDTWYNEFGAKVWIGRIAKKYGYQENELMLSKVYVLERAWS